MRKRSLTTPRTDDPSASSSLGGWIALVVSLGCFAPTAMAVLGALLLGTADLAAWHAVEHEGEDPYLLGFALIFSMIFAIFGAAGLALLGLLLHALGLGLAVLAVRWGNLLTGVFVGAGHGLMLAVDVVYLTFLVILILGG